MKNADNKMIPVIIPAYEPDDTLIGTIKGLSDKGITSIIVINDGSSTDCDSIFHKAQEEYGVVVLEHKINMGKGRALKTAFEYILQNIPEAIGSVTADADGQHSTKDIISCMEELGLHSKSLVLGCRDFGASHVPITSKLGNLITRNVVGYMIGSKITDTQTGLRGIGRDYMHILLDVEGERYEFETNMLIEAKNYGIELREVVIDTIYIDENKSSHFRYFRDSYLIYKRFLRFVLSAISSAVIDIGIFAILVSVLRGSIILGMTHVVVSTIIARIISALYNYVFNGKIVFGSKCARVSVLSRYVILAIVQLSLSAILVESIYRISYGSEVVIKLIVDMCLFLLSYIIQREWVYKKG